MKVCFLKKRERHARSSTRWLGDGVGNADSVAGGALMLTGHKWVKSAPLRAKGTTGWLESNWPGMMDSFPVTHACMYTYKHIHTHTHIHIHSHAYTHTHTLTHIHTYTHTHTHIHSHTHIHTYTYTYTHTQIHTHTHIHSHTVFLLPSRQFLNTHNRHMHTHIFSVLTPDTRTHVTLYLYTDATTNQSHVQLDQDGRWKEIREGRKMEGPRRNKLSSLQS